MSQRRPDTLAGACFLQVASSTAGTPPIADWQELPALLCFLPVETILAHALGQDSTQPALSDKRDLLERLMARLAHEIRNPLSSLDIHVQLLEEDLQNLAPATREQLTPRLDIIHGELHRLKTIVENFLRLTRPSALDLESVELERIINHVCELLRPEAAARGIQILTEVSPNLPPFPGDPVRLTQALLNLLINALQAVERQGRIYVNASVSEERIALQVRDNGPGIPVEKLASIFEPYFTTKPEGSGMGLWIAQQIAAAHGGSLRAQNAPGGGALFTLLLPLKSGT